MPPGLAASYVPRENPEKSMIRSKNSTELAANMCKIHSGILEMIRSPHHSPQTMQNITLSIARIPKALTSSILQKKQF